MGRIYVLDDLKCSEFNCIKRANVTYVPVNRARKFVEFIQGENVRVLGFEGFVLDDENVMPVMDCIYEWSFDANSNNWQQCISALSSIDVSKVTHLEFVLEK